MSNRMHPSCTHIVAINVALGSKDRRNVGRKAVRHVAQVLKCVRDCRIVYPITKHISVLVHTERCQSLPSLEEFGS